MSKATFQVHQLAELGIAPVLRSRVNLGGVFVGGGTFHVEIEPLTFAVSILRGVGLTRLPEASTYDRVRSVALLRRYWQNMYLDDPSYKPICPHSYDASSAKIFARLSSDSGQRICRNVLYQRSTRRHRRKEMPHYFDPTPPEPEAPIVEPEELPLEENELIVPQPLPLIDFSQFPQTPDVQWTHINQAPSAEEADIVEVIEEAQRDTSNSVPPQPASYAENIPDGDTLPVVHSTSYSPPAAHMPMTMASLQRYANALQAVQQAATTLVSDQASIPQQSPGQCPLQSPTDPCGMAANLSSFSLQCLPPNITPDTPPDLYLRGGQRVLSLPPFVIYA